MPHAIRQSLAKSSLGFIVCSVLTTAVHSLHAQQPFGGTLRYTQPVPLANVVNGPGDGPDNPSIAGDGLTLFWDSPPSGQIQHSQIWTATRASLDADWETSHALGDGVNSGVRNLEPDVTDDGLEIYFRRSDIALNYDILHIDDRLMVSTRASTAEPWTEAADLPEWINSLPCLNSPSVTGDGLELYFDSIERTKDQFNCGGNRYADIYVSKRATRNDAWGEPQLVETLAGSPGISSDGLRLFFVPGIRTGTELTEGPLNGIPDLLVKTRATRDAEFGPAVVLGDPPNTPGVSTPTWGPEEFGDTLYFASDRSGTPHGYGVFQTTRAELCDINGDGACDVNDLTARSLFRVNLAEGSERELDIVRYDISGDGRVDENDLATWLAAAASTNGLESAYVRGDANLDGQFNSGDLVEIFNVGKYELASDANWAEGDWTGDRRFDSGDLIAAFSDGGYESGAPAVVGAVPEPTSVILLVFGIIGLCGLRPLLPCRCPQRQCN